MSRLNLRSWRFRSMAHSLETRFGLLRAPACRLHNGRLIIEFRGTGTGAWPAERQVDRAREVVAIARASLSVDERSGMKRQASRAVVVVHEDEQLLDGCSVATRWSITVPAEQ